MLRGLSCRSAGLATSSVACSAAYSACGSPTCGSWVGSASNSQMASFAASTRMKKDAMPESEPQQCLGAHDAMYFDTMRNEVHARPTSIYQLSTTIKTIPEEVSASGWVQNSTQFSLKCFLSTTLLNSFKKARHIYKIGRGKRHFLATAKIMED